MPALDALGWDDERASAFVQLQDDNLFPARVAAQHRGEFALLAEQGELRARAAGRLFYEHDVGGQLPAVGDWVAVMPPATIAENWSGLIPRFFPVTRGAIRESASRFR